jgi:hypothetical protein
MSVVASTTLQAEVRGAAWRGPLQKRLDLPGDVADLVEIKLRQGEAWVPVVLSGWTAVVMLWVTSNREILVTLGDPALNQPIALRAGGILGFAGGELSAQHAVHVTYPGTQPNEWATVTAHVAGLVASATLTSGAAVVRDGVSIGRRLSA